MLPSETRHAIIETILAYADTDGDDPGLLELVGGTPIRADCTDEQSRAVIAAILPLLPDARLDDIIRHIAELLVRVNASTVGVRGAS